MFGCFLGVRDVFRAFLGCKEGVFKCFKVVYEYPGDASKKFQGGFRGYFEGVLRMLIDVASRYCKVDSFSKAF